MKISKSYGWFGSKFLDICTRMEYANKLNAVFDESHKVVIGQSLVKQNDDEYAKILISIISDGHVLHSRECSLRYIPRFGKDIDGKDNGTNLQC